MSACRSLLDLLPLAFLLLASAGCASAGAAAAGPRDPRDGVPPGVRPEWLHFHASSVEPGSVAPDFTLPTADGGTMLSLSTFRGRPLVVVFGSET